MTLLQITRRLFYKLFFIIALFLIFNTCTENKPTAPEEKNNDLATTTIGINGGELKTDDFSLTVPAGSFQSETTLSLSISDESSSYEKSIISEIYLIEGLPNNFDKTIKLMIKYSGNLNNSSYIGVGYKTENVLLGDSSNSYRMISATDSAGFLLGFLRSKNNLSKFVYQGKINSFERIQFTGLTGIQEWRSDKFLIRAHGGWSEGTILEFGNMLHKLYEHITENIEFNFFNRNSGGNCRTNYWNWDWPIEIVVADVKNKVELYYGEDWYVPQLICDGSLLLSLDSPETNDHLGKSLSTLSLNTYDNYCYEKKWLKTAMINWFEGNYGGAVYESVPKSLYGNELVPFEGFQNGAYNLRLGHGGGMVSLLEYLFLGKEVYPPDIIKNVHEENIHPVEYILDHANTFVAEWWPDYFEKLIMGEIYDVNSSVFLDSKNLGGTWDIKLKSDTVESFTLEYPDLSAKRFIINLNYPDIDESAKLSLDAFSLNNDGIATILFGVKSDGDFQHIITAKNAPLETPESLKNYYDEGIRKFLVVVVNSIHNATDYLGKTDIELVAEIKKETTLPDPTTCEVRMRFYGRTHEVIDYYNNVSLIDKDTTYWHNNNFVFPENSDGSFAGNTFTYEYVQDYDNGYSYDVHLTITFSNDKNEIVSMIYRSTTSFAGDGGEWIENRVYHLESIPLENVESAYQEATYSLDGENLCNSIVDISYSYEKETFDWFHESKNLVEFTCNDISYVSIIVK